MLSLHFLSCLLYFLPPDGVVVAYHLLDFPPLLFRKLQGSQRKLLLECGGVPPRVLGFLLRRFLNCKRGTGGDYETKLVASVDSFATRKRGLVRVLDNRVSKRRKSDTSCLNVSLEVKLSGMSGNVYEVYPKTVADGGTAKKKDDAPVPVELWLYWLNAGLGYSFSLKDSSKSVVVLQ